MVDEATSQKAAPRWLYSRTHGLRWWRFKVWRVPGRGTAFAVGPHIWLRRSA